MDRSQRKINYKSMDTAMVRQLNATELIEYYRTMQNEDEFDIEIINSDEEDELFINTPSFDELVESTSSTFVNYNNAMRQQYEVAWSLINIAEPSANGISVSDATASFFELLDNHDEYLISRQAIGVLGNIISFGDTNRIQAFIDSGIIPKILPIIGCNDINVQCTALRTIEKLLSGTDWQVEKIIVEYNLLKYFWIFLNHANLNVRKVALTIICKITSIGSSMQVHSLIRSDLLHNVLQHLEDSQIQFQNLASEAICNLTNRGNKEIVFELIHSQAIKKLCIALKSPNGRIVNNSLDSLYNILKLAGPNYCGYIVNVIQEMDCTNILKNLKNNCLSDFAVQLMDKFDKTIEPNIVTI